MATQKYPIFYFAWVDEGTAFDPDVHNVHAEELIGFRIEHREGDFPALNLDVENPRMPFLSASRKVWAWLSWQSAEGADVLPLFFGRLLGVPKNIIAEVVTLEFIARPFDYDEQKAALAETLKVEPYWDVVWIDDAQLSNPDAVWETRDSIWHIDRLTHTVSDSNLISGEDGLVAYGQGDVPYDSVEINFNEPPLRQVTVNADVNWSQSVSSAVGGEVSVFENAQFKTFGADNIASSWPKTGGSIGGGWTVAFGEAATVVDDYSDSDFEFGDTLIFPTWPEVIAESRRAQARKPIREGWLMMTLYIDHALFYAPPPAGLGGFYKNEKRGIVIPYENVTGTLRLSYAAVRRRKETISFTLTTDVQPLLTMPDQQAPEIITITGRDLGMTFDPGDYPTPIIGDVQGRSFFSTERGQLSIQYLILLARAKLVSRARAIDVSFDVPFPEAVDLTCRKNASIADPRLPHGTAEGKIVAYALEFSEGVLVGHVTISCSIGRGGAVVDALGDPTYVEDGYVDDPYQFRENTVVTIAAGSVGYAQPIDAPNDDGLVFPLRAPPYVVPPSPHLIYPAGGGGLGSGGRLSDIDQATWGALMQGAFFERQDIIEAPDADQVKSEAYAAIVKRITDYFNENLEASIDFTLLPVTGGPFQTDYVITTTELKIPGSINLED